MKNIKLFGSVALICAAACFSGCSDQFLQDKKSYGSFGAATIYEDYDGALTRIDYLYNLLLPVSASKIDYDTPSTGLHKRARPHLPRNEEEQPLWPHPRLQRRD